MAHDYIKTDLGLESQAGKIRLQILATLGGGMLLIVSFVAQLVFANHFYAQTLGLISAVLLGAPLVWVALKDLYHGHAHMNELVALAVVAAMAIGKYQEAGVIAFLMIISVLIESRTALGARASIESLVRITPTRAHLLGEGGETEVDAKDLNEGDVIRVRPGDNIAADGRIIRGESTVNEANITGESLPADKNEGDEVFGGTINLTGVMEIEVTKAGSDTTLGTVKDLILQAERTRIPIARMIDQYAGWYTPTILMLVAVVWFFTQMNDPDAAWERAITMLVVACPCALVLATPTAMVAGLSAAMRLGVYVKSVIDLEAARNITAMVFDKTGTLTTGQLQVTRLSPADGIEGVDLLRAAATVEQHSRHPVARAVTEVARKARLHLDEPQDFSEISGRGVQGMIDGQKVMVGRANWLTETNGQEINDDSRTLINSVHSSSEVEGLSVLYVVRGGQMLGWIGLEDNTRPEAVEAMTHLKDLGLKRMFIVTGDRESVAKRVAGQMGIEYKAEVLPHQKLEMVDDLKEAGHRVAVIGDGVNDAPALAAGDISIAMGAAGSDVAIHSAKIALMNNNLNRIPFLINLSKRTSRVINQNLAIGAGFIVLFEGLAASGYIGPITAAVLHVFSGLVVIFNSARLVRTGEDIEHYEAELLAATQKKLEPGDTDAPGQADTAAQPA